MPFIGIKTTLKLDETQKESIVRELGQAVTLIPGKSERVLMVDIEDNRTMYFAGSKKECCAFVDVRCYKAAPLECNRAFTESVYRLLGDVPGLKADDIYLTVSEFSNWGLNGSLK